MIKKKSKKSTAVQKILKNHEDKKRGFVRTNDSDYREGYRLEHSGNPAYKRPHKGLVNEGISPGTLIIFSDDKMLTALERAEQIKNNPVYSEDTKIQEAIISTIASFEGGKYYDCSVKWEVSYTNRLRVKALPIGTKKNKYHFNKKARGSLERAFVDMFLMEVS